jgi:hypothetical protein
VYDQHRAARSQRAVHYQRIHHSEFGGDPGGEHRATFARAAMIRKRVGYVRGRYRPANRDW